MVYDINKNEKYGKILEEKLSLARMPVAVKLIKSEDEIPEGIEKINETLRHCEMVREAAAGRIFYSTSQEQMCKGGSSAMGLEPVPPKIESGEFYYKLGRFDSVETAKKLVDALPRITNSSYGMIYAPLEKATFVPDVVIVITVPKYGMKITQALVYNSGDAVDASFAGIQSLCADAVAGPMTKNIPNVTLACDGSRGYAGIKDDEIICGIPRDRVESLIEAFEDL